jgi:hypothetical protein
MQTNLTVLHNGMEVSLPLYGTDEENWARRPGGILRTIQSDPGDVQIKKFIPKYTAKRKFCYNGKRKLPREGYVLRP